MGAYCDYCGIPSNAGSGICSSCALKNNTPKNRPLRTGTSTLPFTIKDLSESNKLKTDLSFDNNAFQIEQEACVICNGSGGGLVKCIACRGEGSFKYYRFRAE